jgi:hypothetical protein
MPQTIYRVRLSDAEREHLEQLNHPRQSRGLIG